MKKILIITVMFSVLLLPMGASSEDRIDCKHDYVASVHDNVMVVMPAGKVSQFCPSGNQLTMINVVARSHCPSFDNLRIFRQIDGTMFAMASCKQQQKHSKQSK